MPNRFQASLLVFFSFFFDGYQFKAKNFVIPVILYPERLLHEVLMAWNQMYGAWVACFTHWLLDSLLLM